MSEEGPVFVDIACRYRFKGGKQWLLHYRLIAGEPVVLIHETFDLGDDSCWDLLVSRHFSPQSSLPARRRLRSL